MVFKNIKEKKKYRKKNNLQENFFIKICQNDMFFFIFISYNFKVMYN